MCLQAQLPDFRYKLIRCVHKNYLGASTALFGNQAKRLLTSPVFRRGIYDRRSLLNKNFLQRDFHLGKIRVLKQLAVTS